MSDTIVDEAREREAFESAAWQLLGCEKGCFGRDSEGEYVDSTLAIAWDFWTLRSQQGALPHWIAVDYEHWELPALGQRVLLSINGVVQQETFSLDQSDSGMGCGEYFWHRDDCDECPLVKPGQHWQPLPKPPGEAL